MAALKLFHNPRCSKSRQALALLQEKGVEPEVVRYLDAPPSKAELRRIVRALGGKVDPLLRKKEKVYREKYAGRTLTEAEWIDALVEDPILLERPIAVSGDRAVIGRPPEAVLELL